MEDVLREKGIAQGSPRLALIIVLAGWAIGDAAVLGADERTAQVDQAVSGATLLPPQPVDPSSFDQPPVLQARALLAPPSAKAVDTRTSTDPANGRPTSHLRPHPSSSTVSVSFTPQRLVEQAVHHLAEAESSLRRRANYSAKASAIESLRLIAEARDYASAQTTTAERLREGLTAIRESSDFMGRYGPIDPHNVRRMIESHATEALQDSDATNLSGASAADIYLDTARARLAGVATGNPVATRALVVLAETYRQEKTLGPHADAIAVNLLRAALQSTPSDPAIANELGYLLMRQGILDEAQWALERSLSIKPTVSAAHNLVEVMRQRGNVQGASELLSTIHASQGFFAAPYRLPNAPTVQTLTPAQFAALSHPQQAFPPSPLKNNVATPASSSHDRADGDGEVVPPAQTPMKPSESTTGPVGRVARAISGWIR